MANIGLPYVPFASVLPKIEWKRGQEKKPRLIIREDGDVKPNTGDEEKGTNEAEENEDSVADSSDASSESSEEEEDLVDYINSLLPTVLDDGTVIRKKEAVLDEVEVLKNRPPWYKRQWIAFQNWRERERIRRKHYIYRDYEERVKLIDDRIRLMIMKEIQANEDAVIEEARQTEIRIKNNSMKRAKRAQLGDSFEQEFDLREAELRKLQFFEVNLQAWATENSEQRFLEEQRRREEEEAERLRLLEEQEAAQIRQAAADFDKMYEEDLEITQDVLEMGRKVGAQAGTNPNVKSTLLAARVVKKAKKKKPKKKPSGGGTGGGGGDGGGGGGVGSGVSGGLGKGGRGIGNKEGVMVISLLPDIDFSLRKKIVGPDYETCFDQDLSRDVTRRVVALKCRAIGERGALCLGAELVRGACPQLELLDLTRCEVKSRGLGRILHGIRIGNLYNLRVLILRGNHITPLGLEYIKDLFDAHIVDQLQVLDLRDNELGDDGADTIMRMIMANYFLGDISELLLQNNGISDIGFRKLVKVLQSMQEAKFPTLQRLALEQNDITAACKRELYPLPDYFTL